VSANRTHSLPFFSIADTHEHEGQVLNLEFSKCLIISPAIDLFEIQHLRLDPVDPSR